MLLSLWSHAQVQQRQQWFVYQKLRLHDESTMFPGLQSTSPAAAHEISRRHREKTNVPKQVSIQPNCTSGAEDPRR